jgi:hypothetical protein
VAQWRKLLIRLQGCWGRIAWKGVGDLADNEQGRATTRSMNRLGRVCGSDPMGRGYLGGMGAGVPW